VRVWMVMLVSGLGWRCHSGVRGVVRALLACFCESGCGSGVVGAVAALGHDEIHKPHHSSLKLRASGGLVPLRVGA
jgi:hypothetical protein